MELELEVERPVTEVDPGGNSDELTLSVSDAVRAKVINEERRPPPVADEEEDEDDEVEDMAEPGGCGSAVFCCIDMACSHSWKSILPSPFASTPLIAAAAAAGSTKPSSDCCSSSADTVPSPSKSKSSKLSRSDSCDSAACPSAAERLNSSGSMCPLSSSSIVSIILRK